MVESLFRLYFMDGKDVVDKAARMGVSEVPCFILEGRCAVSGAQDTAVYLQAFDSLGAVGAGAEARMSAAKP